MSSAFMTGVSSTRLTEQEYEFLQQAKPESVILFSRNYESKQQTKELIKEIRQAIKTEVMLAVDHEGGRVVRFREAMPELPSPRMLAQKDKFDFKSLVARAAGELYDWGFNLNLAPVADVFTKKSHEMMYDRCFSQDVEEVAEKSVWFIEAMAAAGISCCAKHFPGSGFAVVDPHRTLPQVTEETSAIMYQSLPFKTAIEAGVEFIMLSHIVYKNIDSDRPATVSKKIIDLLRTTFAFKGKILSDDLEMGAIKNEMTISEAATSAIDAGIDIVLVCESLQNQKLVFQSIRNSR